jgi:hypothetical protein
MGRDLKKVTETSFRNLKESLMAGIPQGLGLRFLMMRGLPLLGYVAAAAGVPVY